MQYALIAIGYTMVYGILRLINFAHGDVFMVAGLMMVYLSASLPLAAAIPLMIILTVLLGFIIERAAYKTLRTAPRMSVMISAIGVSYLLQNLATYVTGGLPQMYPALPGLSNQLTIAGVSTKYVTVVTPVLVVVLVVALTQLINHTRIGMAMRAVSRDFETAQLMGIRINSVISVTFIIGSLLAAIGSLPAVLHQLPVHRPPVRLLAGTAGLRSGGIRRYRLHSRRRGGGVSHRYLREHHQGLRLERLFRRLYLRHPDRGALREAHGSVRRKGHGQSVRGDRLC